MNDPPQAGARPARIIHNSGTKRLWTVTRATDSPPFQEGVAKPSNVRGSSHKKHKKHKILVPFVPFVPLVARSRSYSRFCNILFQRRGIRSPDTDQCLIPNSQSGKRDANSAIPLGWELGIGN